jgi:wyosine [tRNA(Phe)-imidazoG37] synthetase (radical SAM superfamily)
MLLRPQRGILYGPVRSRRLGFSLGINLLPPGGKLCNFDCVYCQYGWSDAARLERAEELAWPAPADVAAALDAELPGCDPAPAYLTFSGNGEPTLHPRFGDVVDVVRAARDRRLPAARTAILSNGTRAAVPAVREALRRLDVRIMKLDAGGSELFGRYNRPAAGIPLAEVVAGLRALGGVTLQSLFAGGPDGNSDACSVEDWLGQVARIAPLTVQIYTLARGYPSERIAPVGRERLEEIRDRAAAAGVAAEVF